MIHRSIRLCSVLLCAGLVFANLESRADEGGTDFQVCVATPRAAGRIKRSGSVPGILVDQFDADTVVRAIHDRVSGVNGHTWEQLLAELRTFMLWEYDGMAGS